MRLLQAITVATFVSTPLVSAVPSSTSGEFHPPAANPPPTHLSQGRSPLRIWTKLRDSVIETIWRLPHGQRDPHTAALPVPLPKAPASIRTRYGDDVVLRFTIQFQSDVEALTEASNILFLDIWGSTDEWVDIRLAKDVVSILRPTPRSSLFTDEMCLSQGSISVRIAS